MASNESILTPETFRLQVLTEQVRKARRRENWFNFLKFVIGYFCVFLIIYGLTIALRPNEVRDTEAVFFVFIVALFLFSTNFVVKFVSLFWPFILYFWASVWTVRQRTLMTLIQTAAETQTPLAEMIHAYASGCYSSRFRTRLERFAAILEQGHPLNEAVSRDPGLFRYDVVSMLRLGGNDPATLRSMESCMSEERDYSPIRSMSIVRVAYFFTIAGTLLTVTAFMLTAIVPKFEAIYKDFDMSLPVMTILTIHASSFLARYFYLFAPLVLLATLLYIMFLIMQTGIIIWRPPFFRRIFRDTDSAKMLRILSVGLKRNLPISYILQVYRYTVPSSYLRRKALQIENDVEKGRLWTESLKCQRIVNTAEASLLETAERTGNTAAVLHQLSLSKERTQLRKDDLTSKLIFIPGILSLALLIGFFATAMFLPLVKLTGALSN